MKCIVYKYSVDGQSVLFKVKLELFYMTIAKTKAHPFNGNIL